MALVKVAFPESPAQLAMVSCLLEASGIPHFVHNAGFGGLYPGVQIALYNNITVMVPAPEAEAALELLSILSEKVGQESETEVKWGDRLRMVAEAFYFGWFVPSQRHKNEADPT